MGAIEDLTEEFKKMPTAGKVAVVGAGGAVLVLTLLAARHNAAQSGGSVTGTDTSGGTPDLSGTIAGAGSGAAAGGDTMTTLMESQLQQILAGMQGGGTTGTGMTGGSQPPQPAPGTKPKPKRKPPVPPPFPKFYTVRPGDSLFSISTKYPVHGAGNWQALYNLNRATIGSNPNLIKPGQRLRLY